MSNVYSWDKDENIRFTLQFTVMRNKDETVLKYLQSHTVGGQSGISH